MDEQRRLILDQFSRQAAPFAEIHARDDAEIHRLLMDTAEIRPELRAIRPYCPQSYRLLMNLISCRSLDI